MKSGNCALEANNANKVQLGLFDERDPRQHQMKLAFGFGRDLAFRGCQEHVYLTREQIQKGVYPQDHPDEELRGNWFVGVQYMNNSDKTQKLSVHHSYVRETETMRLPVNFEDDNNLGASVIRYLAKLSPGQSRIYCQEAGANHKRALTMQGYPHAQFYAGKPLGVNSMRKLFQDGAKILGLPADFKSHSLRHLCITKMANDASVSLAETMRVTHHNSGGSFSKLPTHRWSEQREPCPSSRNHYPQSETYVCARVPSPSNNSPCFNSPCSSYQDSYACHKSGCELWQVCRH